ncbi:MAG: LuxR family transcriptional regulator [Acidovorax sp.]|nr:MAG: LuxR family transcriptional regulator [Acidovorax sp.]
MPMSPPESATARGAQPAQAPSDGPLRALSRGLLRLSDLAQQAQPQDMLHQALDILRVLVPFDSAWWGEVSAGDVHVAPRNWLHGSIGLSQSFAQEWNELAAEDEFARVSMERLGVVIRERDVVGDLPAHPEVMAFSQRHGLYHCMAITAELPHSGLMFFVSIYRPPTRSEFTQEETVLFGEFVVHLLQHWHHVLQRLQSDSPNRPWGSFALAEPSGELLFAGLRISVALSEAWPEWAGTRLPPDVIEALARAPCSLTVGKSSRLQLAPCGPLVAISLASRHQRSPLAPRELSAATLYAHGRSHKDIATTLGLTPATVRTYLRTAYSVLGVSNKLELVAALRKV